MYPPLLCTVAANGRIDPLERVCRNSKAIIINALKWDMEQNALESSRYSLLCFMIVSIFARLRGNEEISELLNLFDF